jgi:hypothetical protein
LTIPLPISVPLTAPYSSVTQSWYSRPTSGRCSKWMQPPPTTLQSWGKDVSLVSPQPLIPDGGDDLQMWRVPAKCKEKYANNYWDSIGDQVLVLWGVCLMGM